LSRLSLFFGPDLGLADQSTSGANTALNHLFYDFTLTIKLLMDFFVELLACGAKELHAFFLELAL